MEALPLIDVHSQVCERSADLVWRALIRTFGRTMTASRVVARLLGCDPAEGSADFGSQAGQTVPGFRIAEIEPGRRLQLRGRHRFADYRLTFLLEDGRLVAQSHAAFPGLLGSLYRTLVIRSGGHRLLTQHLLRRIAQAAR